MKAAALLLALSLAACTSGTAPEAPASPPAAAASPPAAAPTPRAVSPDPDPASRTRTPLVLAVHPTRPPLDIPLRTARAVVAGSVRDWRELGARPGPLRRIAAGTAPRTAVAAVARDPAALAVVPASAVGPGVRAVSVGGRNPLAAPEAYPLTTPGPAPEPVLRMTVVGDLMLARRVGHAMSAAGDFAAPLRPTAKRLGATDITVGNLESTLSRAGAPRQGSDSFGADPRVLTGLRLAGFDVLSLANNHTGDYGAQALVETVRRVRAASIAPLGAGEDSAEARRPVVLERGGVRFGFLAFNAIGETPAARSGSPGAVQLRMPPRTGPLHRGDLSAMTRAIRALRPRVDVLTVLPHWGTQYTTRIVPDQRTVARALVDAGADLVLGGHPHVVQGVELHRGGLIAYSLGNYVFDMDFSQPTREGVIVELTFWGGVLKAAEFVPVRIDGRFAPRVLPAGAGQPVLRRMWAASGLPFRAAS
jgi:poly-gamma-glutamate capsule biosynthesis protein CapA/YwtB (metallophosphatase superfamily)